MTDPVTPLGPPWIIFSDRGKPVAILPAGRPGEVADVRGWPRKTVEAIVRAANSGDEFWSRRMVELQERVLAALEQQKKPVEGVEV